LYTIYEAKENNLYVFILEVLTLYLNETIINWNDVKKISWMVGIVQKQIDKQYVTNYKTLFMFNLSKNWRLIIILLIATIGIGSTIQ
jgi:hypothetical protein